MSKIFSTFKVYSGLYDFAQDPASGAVGTVNLGVVLPTFVRYYYFAVTERTNLTGGATTLAFGYIQQGSAAPTSVTNAFMTATAIASFTSAPLRGVDLLASPIQLLFPVAVTMTIAGAALTGGSLQFDLWTVSTEF